MKKYINKAANQMLDEADEAKSNIYRLIYKKEQKELIKYIDSMLASANNQDPIEDLKIFVTGNWSAIMRTYHNKIITGCSAEGHVSHVLSDRLSSRPMAWSETGADRIKMRFQRWAIQTNETANARMEAERKAAAQEKEVKRAVKNVARSATGTIGREIGKSIGGSVGGSFGKRLGGNVGASLGRGILNTLFK